MTITNLVVAGGGVLGSQIAYQSALKGLNVTIYDINEQAIQGAKQNVDRLLPSYKQDMGLDNAGFKDGLARLHFSTSLVPAITQADLVIEAITERLNIKARFYQDLSAVAPDKTIFASNSSSLLPSQLVGFTDRPDKFLHIHFANQIWRSNSAEIMGTPATSPAVTEAMVAFAKQIGMVPIPIKKEQPGYVLNSMLIPWLNSALKLWAKDIAAPEVIDKTWMIDLQAPIGPFGIMDIIGMKTHYQIVAKEAEESQDPDLLLVAAQLKKRIDANLLGPSTGQGFYQWPNPEFFSKDFLH